MYTYPKRPDEIYHFGVSKRNGAKVGSGRYRLGSGDRPYQRASSSIISAYRYASEKEKTITDAIKNAIKGTNVKLYGLENRLKTVDSIWRKVDKKKIEDNVSEKEAIDDMHDLVRYTTISDTKSFVSNYEAFKRKLGNLGYTETKCKNYFEMFNQGLVKHKSVQSQFSTSDGFTFEVQFQTPESQDAKTKKIPLYEERRQVGISSERAKELESEMEKLALNVPNPPGIEKIKSHQSNEKNAPELKNYKGHAYFVSTEDMDGKIMEPRVPNNFFTDKGFEDNVTKRVCFAPSIDKCLMGLSQNLKGKQFYVYEPVKYSRIYKPNTKAVPDSKVTDELWIKEPVQVRKVSTIKVIKDAGKDGLPFEYGNGQKAELYEWDYEFLSDDTIKHSDSREVNFKMNDFYYLAHGGPGSGRYPLGSGDRPYQKFEKSRKRRGILGYIKEKKQQRSEQKQVKLANNEAKKRVEAERKKQEHEANRSKVIRAGSASDIIKYQGELSNDEYRNIITRLDYERHIRDLSAKETRTAVDKVNRIADTMKNVNNWTSTGIDSYNLFASIYNVTDAGKKKPLKIMNKPNINNQQNNDGGKKKK